MARSCCCLRSGAQAKQRLMRLMSFFVWGTGPMTLNLSRIKTSQLMMTIIQLQKLFLNNKLLPCVFCGKIWGYNEIYSRATSVPVNQEPNFQDRWKQTKISLPFLKIILYKFYNEVILEQTSSALIDEKLPLLPEAEFFCYIGIWL